MEARRVAGDAQIASIFQASSWAPGHVASGNHNRNRSAGVPACSAGRAKLDTRRGGGGTATAVSSAAHLRALDTVGLTPPNRHSKWSAPTP